MNRIHAMSSALVAVLFAAMPAAAAEERAFNRAEFTAALDQGRPIIVEVRAWWCPVCASQRRTIRAAASSPQFGKLVIFEINYDRQETEWKSFNVHKQGTLIAFRDSRELGRIEFETDKAKINALLAKTVN